MSALPQPQQSNRIIGLDALRFIAAFMVMVFHYTYEAGRPHKLVSLVDYPAVAPFTMYLNTGVFIFFIISGFVISMSIRPQATPLESAWHFLRSRVLRLVPLFLVCLLLTTCVTLVFGAPKFTVTPLQFLANLTFYARPLHQPYIDGVYWTLQVEWQFYLTVALLIYFGILPRQLTLFAATWLGITALLLFIPTLENGLTKLLFQPSFAPFFCIGILLNNLYAGKHRHISYLLIAIACFLACHSMNLRAVQDSIYQPAANPTIYVLTLIPVVLLVSSAIWWKNPPFADKFAFFGNLSYPYYLVHGRMGYIFFNNTHGMASNGNLILIAASMAFVVSIVLAQFVEPRLKRLFAALLPQKITPLLTGLRLKRA